ncbi:AMP-binding protein [Novosphingobium colocasiae]|uniref:3-methylmercaptopropionyl-CoA ligase n=1 Tax=Novosphingobium colocasiae TaxID=1256513 RepID=A0A918UI63_9SPHN|nr:AMP-binding protein [Novosphingobium colocasiae]GGZ11396.1 AMP-binding protein [Novosphingobium colocasiae]
MNDPSLSQLIGPVDPPLLDLTIGEALESAARKWPGHEALVSRHQGIRLTWSELLAMSDDFAAGLLALGILPGDRVAVWAPNCAEWAIAQFATARAGMIQVNINPAYRASELEYTLRKVGVRALICASSFKTSDYVAMVETLGDVHDDGRFRSELVPDLALVIKIGGGARTGWLDFNHVAAMATERSHEILQALPATQSPRDPINIQFTSGTTGSPKGATLSHRNVLNNGYFVGLGMGLREGDRLCIPVPLYHCFGMVLGNLACLVHGATMIYPSSGFEPLAVLETVEAERCTGLHGVPTMFIAELEHPEFSRFDLGSLRTGIMAGSPCPVEVMRKVMARMHMQDIGIAYGMTETSPVSFQTATDDPIEVRVGTIGQVLPHLEVKVVDPATGKVVPRGHAGELCTKGYSVMLGYWNDPERTAEAIRDGWMHTGDLGIVDEAGLGRIVGRIKDMIIRGGENIYPREIEEFLYTHPAVEDVQVIGVPDEKYGEDVLACVLRRAGAEIDAEGLINFCRGRIAHYKVPRYVRFVDSFPMTVSGKVQKYLLRETMIALLAEEAYSATRAL